MADQPAELRGFASVTSPTDRLDQTDDYWWVGLLALQKSTSYERVAHLTHPRYRRGYNFPVTPTMRFFLVAFTDKNNADAYAIILTVPEDNDDYFAGWVTAAHHAKAVKWVNLLNRELDRLRALASVIRRDV
jgi:hypothetical protein